MDTLSTHQPHRRLNALTGEWVFVSPHRTQRPWQGKVEVVNSSKRPAHDANCYLCAGNLRANGERNPDYRTTHAFTNDFAAFKPEKPEDPASQDGLFSARTHAGTCRVLCFSPRHDLTLADLTPAEIRCVVDLWIKESAELGKEWRWVQVFENKGELMGCSNPHPHGQIWASDYVPNGPAKEDLRQREWYARDRRPLLLDYAEQELAKWERVIAANEQWLAVIPWWAVWPFEVLVLPRRPWSRLVDLPGDARDGLSVLLQQVLSGYDRLFGTSFPYSMGWHGAPFDGAEHPEWTVHAHFYPPLLRSATVKKFMVGFELLAEAQRDLTAEQAAGQLRRACEMRATPGNTL
jgi:UDPglucose--hexose-1-phosphate uridylyltransferase